MPGAEASLAQAGGWGTAASSNNVGSWGSAGGEAQNVGGWGSAGGEAQNVDGWDSAGGDGGDSPYSGHGSPYYASPHYAPTDASTTGHYGDVSASVDSSGGTPHYAPTEEGSPASVDSSGCVCGVLAASEASSAGTQQDAPTDGGSAASEGLSPVTAPERELLAFVKLTVEGAACLSRKTSMSTTSARWLVEDQLTSDFVHCMCSELG